MTETEKLRVFLALPRDTLWVESTRDLVERLRRSLPEASWTRPASWHLTLKFLGEVSLGQATEFASALTPAMEAAVPGEIMASQAVVFPLRGPARVLGIGFAPSETLEWITRLAAEGERQARRLGLSQENRDFHPHVTLARLRRPWPDAAVESYRSEVDGWRFPSWHARSCVLYQSHRERDGAVHTPLQEWSFAGGPRGVRA